MMNLTYTTKNPHGLTRDMLIDEMLNKRALLEDVGHDRGLEDDLTIELYKMNERGESYATMVEYKNLYENAEREKWFGFEM